jgi:hypothetical protein
MNDDDVDRTLGRLAAGTAALRPTRGFEDRVLAAVGTNRTPGWDHNVLRFGKVMLAIAALSAVTGSIVGFRSLSAETDASATAYGMEELDW